MQNTERNLGEQPIAQVLEQLGLQPADMVAVSTQQITHKMISRACKGRRLTVNVQCKIRDALNQAAGSDYSRKDLFNYTGQ